MAVSHFKDNKFGISREKKKVFIRSVFLTLVENYSQRTAFSDVLIILPLLVLGALKKDVTDSRVSYFLLTHFFKDRDRRFAKASPGDK